MIHFEQTHDMELVRQIMTHPMLYPHLVDDNCPSAEEFYPREQPGFLYLVAYDGTEVLGLWFCYEHEPGCWGIHTCLLPSCWGQRAREAARKAPLWMWNNTSCRRIVTNVPAYNHLALRFAERCGMRRYGVKEKSFLKNGQLHDEILLELVPEEEVCQLSR